MNNVYLVGNTGRDFEVRTFSNGGNIANGAVATTKRWKDKEGQPQERTTWHNIVVRSPFGIEQAKQIAKGTRVFIKGTLETRKYKDKDDVERIVTEVVVDYDGEIYPIARTSSGVAATAVAKPKVDDLGDDIPF